ncbi:hypothetical protein PGIGA_G00162200 [Pangasianodon gigas]|uniref:Uncharacterized protein n=1 Tax=Pangasianodon gigas TaxID=30993 RepID=A0ACC5XTE4_PANGG|nr:hypothetical protein [Pangasianodon gigas]
MTSYLWILLFGALVITKAQDLSLTDALDNNDDKPPTSKPEQKPPKTGGDGLDLADALLPDPKKPDAEDPKQPVVPPKGGGGFSDTDLEEAGNDGYNPDVNPGGRSGGNAGDIPDTQDDSTKAAEGGQMAGIISAVAVAIFGAASSYFAYQKKKLCFKAQGGTDPESGRTQSTTQSDPQAYSNLLRSS